MKVKHLRQLLVGLDDNIDVVTPSRDHAYSMADVYVTTALKSHYSEWSEDFGEDSTPETPEARRVTVLVVGSS